MKRILASTALALVALAPAMAPAAAETYVATIEQGIRASHFIGKRVYTVENDIGTDPVPGQGADWQDIGEISDVILGPSGGVDAVLVDVGGFLGIGEKTVAVNLSQIHRVADANSPDNYFLVFRGSKADLEGAPVFSEAMADHMENTAPTTPTAGDTVANTAGQAADSLAAGTAAAGAAVSDLAEGPVDFTTRTADQWNGVRVYDPAEKDIGEISGVTTDESGAITGVLVDVGGFLGIGEKRVALSADMLSVVKDADGTGTHVRVDASEDALKQLPTYQG